MFCTCWLLLSLNSRAPFEHTAVAAVVVAGVAARDAGFNRRRVFGQVGALVEGGDGLLEMARVALRGAEIVPHVGLVRLKLECGLVLSGRFFFLFLELRP